MFKPNHTITPQIASLLMRIEALKQEINGLPITLSVIASLRETARLESIHYSTKIEGNRLTEEEVIQVIKHKKHFAGRERDAKEILGYYAALDEVEKTVKKCISITEKSIQQFHALVMGGGKKNVTPTPYRDGQNVIRDGTTHKIVYLPPEAADVASLMKDLVAWIHDTENTLPCPLRASIAHYQFATIHPYYDGNGRTARLLTTFILHQGGYDLKGLYSLEEYYAKNLSDYYNALAQGPSHNYYSGRAEADITLWVEYFCHGIVESFENVKRHAVKAYKQGLRDKSLELKNLDAQQRATLNLFQKSSWITSHDIEQLFKLKSRTARALCLKWVQNDFLHVTNPAKKTRKYMLTPTLQKALFGKK